PRRVPLSPKGVMEVLATDDGRALALDATGRALSSTDFGKSWKDATSLLGTPVAGLREEGDEIALALQDGGAWLQPDGGFERRAFADGKRAWRPPAKAVERWRRSFSEGVPLSGMRTWLGEGRGTLIVDLRTGSASSVKEVGPEGSSCTPVSLDDEGLIVCGTRDSKQTTLVISHGLRGTPVIEQTFPGSPQFLAGRTLAILASCSGVPAEGTACVRRSAGVWAELKASPALLEAWQPLYWLPRENGGIAVIAAERDVREGEPKAALLDLETNRVTPWNATTRQVTPSDPFGRPGSSLSVLADGSVRGYTATGTVVVDAQGHMTPGAREFVAVAGAGAHALARDQQEHLWQTNDSGDNWREIAPPPFDSLPEGVSAKMNPRPSGRATWTECSADGCALQHSSGTGMWLRLGWPEDPPSSQDGPPAATSGRVLTGPAIPAPALPRLRCASHTDGPRHEPHAPNQPTDPEASEQWLDVLGGKRALARRGSRSFVNLAYRDVFSADNDYIGAGLRAAVHLRAESGAAAATRPGVKTALDLWFVEPFELGGRIRQFSGSIGETANAQRAARRFEAGETEGAARPLLGSEPGRAGGVLLNTEALSLFVPSSGKIEPIRPGCKATSGYVDARGERFVACAKQNASTRIETLVAPAKEIFRALPAEHFRDRESPGLRFFAPGEPALVNPDAIAVAGDGQLAILRLPPGDEPPTVDNPAWLLSAGAPPVELAPWSTLDVATSPGCKGDGGFRAIVQTGQSWLDVPGASPPRSGAGMTALVRWSVERVCLEAVEVGFGSVEGEQSRPLHLSAVARFAGGRPGAALIGTESSVTVRDPASCVLESR
ncbi:MAG TPA: hypothetical protein VHM25_15560, partial [Polyangiaceae bacterium]|nr:hypothetical protein [Polyangiaceae bacterium]